MKPAIWFKGSDIDSLAQEVSIFLREQEALEFDDLLFCVDGELLEHLEGGFFSSFPGKKKVPRETFQTSDSFDFERCRRGDWMHLKVYGVLERKALIGIQSPVESSYIPSEPVRIRLTHFEKKPKWAFA
jgi:hypothetical protein